MTQRSRKRPIAAHRTVRSLADGEGPFAGELVTQGDEVLVRVDTALLSGWPGWRFAGTEHVAAPRDVALRADGQDALLPWCVRSGDAYLAQRAAEGGLANGEAVTLAVSVLRGLAELAVADDPDGEDLEGDALRGEWWLTHDARPVFVIGSGDAPLAASARLLGALEAQIEDRALCRTLARLRAATEEPRRLLAEVARREQELLEFAAPRPLRVPGEEGLGSDLAQVRVADPRRSADRTLRRRDLRGRETRGRDDVRDSREARGRRRLAVSAWGSRGPGARTTSPTWMVRLARIRRALARRDGPLNPSQASRRVSAPRRGVDAQRPANRRRRWAGPAVVAVGAATAIAVLGAVWPSGTGEADAADRRATVSPSPLRVMSPETPARVDAPAPSTSPSPSSTSTPTPAPAPQERAPEPSRQQDPLQAAAELILSAQGCARTPIPACAEIWDGGDGASRVVRDSVAVPVLIEDYGDIAAVRNPVGGQAQMVVIIRRDAGWRIRDVYDIADPPAEGAGTPG